MSRQSKGAKLKLVAKQFSEIRKSGGHGPEKTKPLHGKVNTKKKLGEAFKQKNADSR